MKSRANGMSCRWDVAQLKSRANGMSRNWEVAQMGYRAVEMSRIWKVAQMGCRAIEMSRRWDNAQKNVAQMMWTRVDFRVAKKIFEPLPAGLKNCASGSDWTKSFRFLVLFCLQILANLSPQCGAVVCCVEWRRVLHWFEAQQLNKLRPFRPWDVPADCHGDAVATHCLCFGALSRHYQGVLDK